jgi:predicted PurR-regulated permease PerM
MDIPSSRLRSRPPPVEPAPSTDDAEAFWRSVNRAATIGIFLLAALAALQFSRALLLPVTLAVVIGMMLAPIVDAAVRRGVPSWIASVLLVAAFFAVLSGVVLVLSGFVTEWIAKSPEIGSTLQQKLQIFVRPLAALRDLQGSLSGPLGIDLGSLKFDMASNFLAPILSVLTPAVAQLLLFFGTLLFFLASHERFRRYLIAFSARRRNRLRVLRIVNDVERNLSSYVGILTLINVAVGLLTAIVAALLGLPDPVALGTFAFALNYVPLLGPGTMAVTLFVVGLVSFSSLAYALLAPAIFVAQATVEGNFVTPNIVGRRMTVNPFAIFLSIAFWVWLWGPLGALLAMPVLIVLMVLRAHLFPREGAGLARQ